MKKLLSLIIALLLATVMFAQETHCTNVFYTRSYVWNAYTKTFQHYETKASKLMFCMSAYHIEITNELKTYIFLDKAEEKVAIENGTMMTFTGHDLNFDKYKIIFVWKDTGPIAERTVVSVLYLNKDIYLDYHLNPY